MSINSDLKNQHNQDMESKKEKYLLRTIITNQTNTGITEIKEKEIHEGYDKKVRPLHWHNKIKRERKYSLTLSQHYVKRKNMHQ